MNNLFFTLYKCGLQIKLHKLIALVMDLALIGFYFLLNGFTGRLSP